MATRKTIDIRTLLDMVNDQLAGSTHAPAGRYSLCGMIEAVLMDAKLYRGFGFLTAEHVPPEQLPGVMPRAEFERLVAKGDTLNGVKLEDATVATILASGNKDYVFPDESRRNYIVASEIAAQRRALFAPTPRT
jgi:hypothetical protein